MLGALGKIGVLGNGVPLPRRVRSILAKYGATLLLPGVSGALRFGYQPGNYRESTGQTLAAADQQVGLVVDAARVPGPELVTNGDFSNGTTGWTNGAGLTPMVVGGVLQLARSGAVTTSGAFRQSFPVVAGRAYRLNFSVANANAGRRVDCATQVLSAASAAVGNVSVLFIADGPTATLNLWAANDGTTTHIDNVSVRELPGIHASQSTSGFQPVLRNASSIQSWQFDGTDDRFSLSAVPFQMADDHFVVLGLSSEDVYTERRPFFVRNGTTMFGITFGGSGQNTLAANWIDDAGLNCSVSSANAVHNNTNYAVSMRKAGNSKTLRRDGVQLGLNTVQLGTATLGAAVPFIGMENGVSRPFRGPIHGVIFGKGAITDSEVLVLERFVASLQGRSL